MSKTIKKIALFALLLCPLVLKGQEVSVSLRSVPVSRAISEIQKASGYSIVVKSDGLDLNRQISLTVDNEGIQSVLTKVFEGQQVEISVSGKNVFVTKKASQVTSQSVENQIVRGVVLDESGMPLMSAVVQVKGRAGQGVITNLDGEYQTEAGASDVLVISFIGYKTQEIPVDGRKRIDIAMEPDSQFLEATVVIGYGVQKKVNLSGSVSAVNLEEAGENRALTNLSAGLQGVAAGLLAQQSSGEPGADEASITIRGLGTLNNSAPLVVIDGVIGSMNDVNPNDVATMSVLKDAASSAIYGSRAANGVILITTKSGKEGQSKIIYNGKAGWQRVAMPIDVVSDYVTYMKTINQASANAGSVKPYSEDIIDEWRRNTGKNEIYCNTDWFDEVFRPSFLQEHNLQASGGNKSVNYLVSIGYLQNEGTMEGTGYKRYSVRANIGADVTKWLRLTANVNGYYGRKNAIEVSNAMASISNSSPGTLPKSSDGRFGGEWAPGGNAQAGNIFAANSAYDKLQSNYKMNGKLGLDVTILPNLVWHNSAAANGDFYVLRQMNYPDVVLWDLKNNAPLITTGTTSNQLTEQNGLTYALFLDSFVNWDILPESQSHHLSLTAGYNQEYNRYHYTYAQAMDVLSASTPTMDAAATPSAMKGNSTDSAVQSVFGRVNYDWKGRYLFEANARADGSSRFAPGHRWGFFPSFSAAWRISEEPWFKLSSFNNLKVRASWGKLGNNAVGDYATQLMYERRSYVFDGKTMPGVGISAIVNDKLSWETTTMTNIGLDVSALKGQLTWTADLFNKLTDDILIRASIPGVFGRLEAPFTNAGKVRNRGLETEISWKGTIPGDVRYGITANYTFVRNKVLKYHGNIPTYSGQRILLEGYGIYDYYVREVDCIATQDKIDQMLADGYEFYPSTPQPGDFIYKDQQKEGEKGYKIIDDDDRVIKGHSYPSHFFGLTFNAGWKGIDFSIMFSGVAGISQYLNGTWYTNVLKNGSVINKKFLKAWTPDNPNSKIPALTTNDGGRNTVSNDFWLQDASYAKLRNLTLGYTFPDKWTSPFISRARIYFTGENLLTLTRFEGLDPENGSSSNYPNVSRYIFGISLTF
ncbi:MAG: TonB-dependent receptor [Bacteroidales bacterium]|nr:TonB-dependent receptor [Bacteroidales bacterium]